MFIVAFMLCIKTEHSLHIVVDLSFVVSQLLLALPSNVIQLALYCMHPMMEYNACCTVSMTVHMCWVIKEDPLCLLRLQSVGVIKNDFT